MEYLPQEILLGIGQYLTEKDLAACCAVSHAWRDAFNVDVVWRSRCDLVLVQYLRDTKCVVEPSFVSPEVTDSGLSDLCEWRLNYMRQNHLYNNWRQGRYRTFRVTNKCPTFHSFSDCTCMFYGNDFAVICRSFIPTQWKCEGKVQLWSLTRDPIIVSQYNVPVLGSGLKAFVFGNLVVLYKGVVVQVLSITSSLEFQFKHAFCFTESGKILEPVHDSLMTQEMCRKSLVTAKGPIVVALSKEPNLNEKLHVWNVETGEKLKEEVYEDLTFVSIHENKRSKENKVIVIAHNPFNMNAPRAYTVLIYDLTHLLFHPFIILSDFPVDSVIHTDTFAVRTIKNLKIYNIATQQLVLNIPLAVPSDLCTFGDSILFGNGHKIQLFNTKNSEVQLFFEYPERDYHVLSFSVLCEKFICVFGGQGTQITETYNPSAYLLEGKNQKKVMSPLPFRIPFTCINTLCTKLMYPDYPDSKTFATVFHYW